jgi:putative peptidoglycan lipid II flippase
LSDNKNSVAKTALAIAIKAAVSKALGFMREWAVAYVYGAGAVTDAFAIASRVVGTAGLIVSTYMTTTFVPAYARLREEQGEGKALQFANDMTGLSLLVNVLFVAILQIAAPLVLKITGFNPEQSSLALTAVRICLFQLPINVFVYMFTGYLTARKSFWGPNFIGIPLSVTVAAACFLLGTDSGVTGLALANLMGVAAQMATFIIWLPKEKYKYKFSMRFNAPEVRKSVKLLVPALLGSAIYELNIWVDTVIATYLGEGSAAAIGFAARLLTFVQGLIILPLADMTFSYMSEYAAKKESDKMLGTLWGTIRITLLAVIPIVVIAIPSSRDIIRIVYQHGEFMPEATLLTSSALVWYLPSLIGTAAHAFLLRFFYVLQDTKTPMFCGAASVAVNIALSVVLSNNMGIAGVALATSIGSILSPLLLLAALRRKMGALGFGRTAIDILKIMACAVPCALAVLGMRHALSGHNSLVRFAACACTGGAAYLVSAFFLKAMALMDLLDMLKARFCRSK